MAGRDLSQVLHNVFSHNGFEQCWKSMAGPILSQISIAQHGISIMMICGKKRISKTKAMFLRGDVVNK